MNLIGLLGILSVLCCVAVVNGSTDTQDRSDFFSHILNWFRKTKKENVDKIYGHPKVHTTKGNIRGQTNVDAHSFYAIPYAEAPIGSRRFMPPVEKPAVAEIEASKPNFVKCYQGTGPELSEDCLVLNVHVPKNVDANSFTTRRFDQLRPVLVWIHGGAFQNGAGTAKVNDGRFLSKASNTLVVTINYRLGALGFLVFDENGVRFNGNQGLQDQRLALKWVKEHIRNFGGDPDQITIFGESAGGQSVMLHLASKSSKPYFKRCIMQSNPASYYYPTLVQAKKVADELVGLLQCGTKYSSNIACLRTVAPADIIKYTKSIRGKAFANQDLRSVAEPFRPVVDGVEYPKQPLTMFKEGNWNTDVDVIIGTTRQEMFVYPLTPAKFQIPSMIFKLINRFFFWSKLGPKVTSEYLHLLASKTKTPNYNVLLSNIVGDSFFICPTRLLARFISKTSTSKRTYLYSWEHMATKDPAKPSHYSCHACEIPYLFRTTQVEKLPNEKKDQWMSDLFSDLWGSFARTGVPTSKLSDAWVKYDGVTDEDLHMKYPRAKIEAHLEKVRCDFWDKRNFYATKDIH